MSNLIAADYLEDAERELKNNILPFWINNTVDEENGGFYGYISNDVVVDRKAHKGCILNSRILWTYSAAYNMLKCTDYLHMAQRAYDFMKKHFWDYKYSGLYWMTDYTGKPINTKKQVYNLAFGIYGLSEYYKASGDENSLKLAVELFRVIEEYAYDRENKGYIEALSQEWNTVEDMRLSIKDIYAEKSMNTHLHVLEAYTNLMRVWRSDELKAKLKELIEVFEERIIDSRNYCFKLFFDREWNTEDDKISFGHDIEGSWLLYEAAEALGDKGLLERTGNISVLMAKRVYERGVDTQNGGIYNEGKENGICDSNKPWWPQAEAAVGFLNAFWLTQDKRFFDASYQTWSFIKKYIVDEVHGEWFSMVSDKGEVYAGEPKVEPWKCPYHNSRACMELMARLVKVK